MTARPEFLQEEARRRTNTGRDAPRREKNNGLDRIDMRGGFRMHKNRQTFVLEQGSCGRYTGIAAEGLLEMLHEVTQC